MKEREFQTELIRGLRHTGFHPVPIPDSGAQRFGVKKVYDLGIGGNGLYYGAELKRATTSLNFSELKPHQRKGLEECRNVGLGALVICVFAHDGGLLSGRKSERRSRKTLEVWAMTYQQFCYTELTSARRSLPLHDWRIIGRELIPIRCPAFDRNGEPKFNKRGKREWNWGWDFTPAHQHFRRQFKRPA